MSWLLLTAALSVSASEPVLQAELAHREAFLGDSIELRVTVRYDPAAWQSVAPAKPPGEKLGEATVLSHTLGEPIVEEGVDLVTRELKARLAWYELGAHEVPALSWIATAPDGETTTLETASIEIEIIPMLDEEDGEIAPAKGQVDLDRLPLWPWLVGGGLLLIGLIALLVWWLRRDKKAPPPPEPKPLLPPYEEAIRALGELTHGSLLKEGRIKEFYVAINLIVRRYYGRLFDIHAEEMTSFEIEEWMREEASLPAGLTDVSLAFQEQCDRVKFAKFDPVEAENRETVNRAYQIVEMLKPKPEEARGVATG